MTVMNMRKILSAFAFGSLVAGSGSQTLDGKLQRAAITVDGVNNTSSSNAQNRPPQFIDVSGIAFQVSTQGSEYSTRAHSELS
jgi:hypothetical protein